MTFKEKMNMFFNKKKMIKALIVDHANKVRTYYIKIDTDDHFNVGERRYDIDNESVVYSKGIPTYFYAVENPKPINPHEELWTSTPLTSDDYFIAINTSVTKDILKYSGKKNENANMTLVIGFTVLFLAIAGGLYYIYNELLPIIEYIETNKDLMEAIRESILNGGGVID